MTPRRPPESAPVTRESIDLQTRLRIAANLRFLKRQHKFRTAAAMGRSLGITRQAMLRYLKGERTVGLDVALAVHRRLHVSLDWLVSHDPPREWFGPEHDGD